MKGFTTGLLIVMVVALFSIVGSGARALAGPVLNQAKTRSPQQIVLRLSDLPSGFRQTTAHPEASPRPSLHGQGYIAIYNKGRLSGSGVTLVASEVFVWSSLHDTRTAYDVSVRGNRKIFQQSHCQNYHDVPSSFGDQSRLFVGICPKSGQLIDYAAIMFRLSTYMAFVEVGGRHGTMAGIPTVQRYARTVRGRM